MNRSRKMQIIASIALFAIFFSVVSTALLVVFSSNTAPQQQELDLSDFIVNSGATITATGTQVTGTGETLTGTTK